jgi:hypothetical protein
MSLGEDEHRACAGSLNPPGDIPVVPLRRHNLP